MKSSHRLIKILFVLVFLNGCAASYTSVSFEILEPAVVSLPEHVSHVGILNRAPISYHVFDSADIRNLTKEQLVKVDTVITLNILKSLNQKLSTSKVSAYHLPIWFSSRRKDTIGLDIPLTKREVNDLCRMHGVDIIISLEYYKLNIEVKKDWDLDYLVSEYYEVSNQVKWAIYQRDFPRPFNEYTTRDTLVYIYWLEGYYYDTGESLDKVRDISRKSGETYGNYLVPTWSVVNRTLYKGRGSDLRKAIRYTNKGEWDSAYTIWNHLLVNEDSALAAKAAYNLAIYFELEDKLDTALRYVKRSHNLDSTDLSESYQDDLEVRIINRDQVLKQVN